MRHQSGTGIGRGSAAMERADNDRILLEYQVRLKAKFPCGTHTLYRKSPRD